MPADHPVRLFADHWRKLRGDRPIPARQDFSPINVPVLLPYLVVLELTETDDGPDLHTRLEGEYMISLTGRSNMGASARHVMEEDGYFARLQEARETLGNGEAQFAEIEALDHKNKTHKLLRGVFPFVLDGDRKGQIFIVVGENGMSL
ncbi:PAS domain-containing protein [Emcibacter nanhaiensis]|uniref:PAS domain-containing protein n=1 Tax=Emcibacter nanhaiensis TaxID=1505037 RepID=UPI001C616911|nr:PAS domain-containing protein [Emcibacter nanhaiensis]